MEPRPTVKNAVMGIDAAWTRTKPSGVALLCQGDDRRWRCAALAPSYLAFGALAAPGTAVNWGQAAQGTPPDPQNLMAAARKLLPTGADHVLCVAVDMPMAMVPILTRRCADNEVSKKYGAAGCATHSPSPARPGTLGQSLTDGFLGNGLELAVQGTVVCPGQAYLVEVFPHPALLMLLQADYRVPYKVSKAGRYWPGRSVPDRIALLLEQFERILSALQVEIEDIPLALPPPGSVRTLSELKRYEDALDALVSAWVGTQFLAGSALAHGDATAAIWCPLLPTALAHNPVPEVA